MKSYMSPTNHHIYWFDLNVRRLKHYNWKKGQWEEYSFGAYLANSLNWFMIAVTLLAVIVIPVYWFWAYPEADNWREVFIVWGIVSIPWSFIIIANKIKYNKLKQ